MNHTTQTQLLDLLERQKLLWQKQKQSLPQQDFDEQWLSPCQVGDVQDDLVQWSAVKRDSDVDLANNIIKSGELSGIFNLVLEGLKRILKQRGFSKSLQVEAIG
ncbi:MAG: SecY-interacting protein Syd, partial [Psychromonas sp.]